MLIYVVYDRSKFNEVYIKNEHRRQLDRHSFYFPAKDPLEDRIKYYNLCDEIWTYGNCENMRVIQKAREDGKDIWVMG